MGCSATSAFFVFTAAVRRQPRSGIRWKSWIGAWQFRYCLSPTTLCAAEGVEKFNKPFDKLMDTLANAAPGQMREL
jgi:hypothetical protein